MFIKRVLRLLLPLLLALIAVMLIRTYLPGPAQVKADPVSQFALSDSAANHLRTAISIRTVSYSDTLPTDTNAFKRFRFFLERVYPGVHARLNRYVINGSSLLFEWKGSNPSLKPVIFMGHMDVVPVGADSAKWLYNPFQNQVKDSIVGRGAMDDKVAVTGLLEAAEKLLHENYKPERTIYFAFGHDEEIGGHKGAYHIASWLKEHHVQAAFILDEGLAITQKIVKGIDEDVALIGTAEKGSASVRLRVQIPGGHSSDVMKRNAIAVLSAAIAKLEDNQMPAHFTPAFSEMNEVLSGHMPFFNRMALRNQWLFKPLIFSVMSGAGPLNAAIRTTTAPTLFHSGIKENILPEEASAVINFRILPGDSVQGYINHIKKVLNDTAVKIELLENADEPSPSSPTDSGDFRLIAKTVKSIYPKVIVSPGLVIGATDSHHYYDISHHIYRFLPIKVSGDDLKRIHGVNERIRLDEFGSAINFYYQMLSKSGRADW